MSISSGFADAVLACPEAMLGSLLSPSTARAVAMYWPTPASELTPPIAPDFSRPIARLPCSNHCSEARVPCARDSEWPEECVDVSQVVRHRRRLGVALLPRAAACPERARPPIAGTVRDSSGGAIPGATVRVVNEATRARGRRGQRRAGGVSRDRLAPGAYRVEATLDGFETAVRQVALDERPDGRRRADADAGAAHRRRGRHRAARRRSGAGSADSGVGRRPATSSRTPAPSTSTA